MVYDCEKEENVIRIFSIINYFKDETSYLLWNTLFDALTLFGSYIKGPERKPFMEFTSNLFMNAYFNFGGFEAKVENDLVHFVLEYSFKYKWF